ncbi:MAG: hypothetical protein VYE15_02745 [Myxococcota bacterium]|nr:hypothetical protein [Myxococcota bacterium]
MVIPTRRLFPLLALALFVHWGGPVGATPERDTVDLSRSLGDLRSGPSLALHREHGRTMIYDPYQSEVVLVIDALHLETAGPASSVRPSPGAQALTRVVRDPSGAEIYTHAVTWRGARITVIAPGQVNDTGLHVVAFDNDDFTITDGLGRLVFKRRTHADGTLSERQGAPYGCGCERMTSPDGNVNTRDL